MDESLLTSDDSLELSIQGNKSETIKSYSLLFDKNENNFSTSSEISFLKHPQSTNDIQQAVNYELREENQENNPWLLLFQSDDKEERDENETHDQTSMKMFSTFDSKTFVNDKLNFRRDSLNNQTNMNCQQHQSERIQATKSDSDDDGDKAFEKFLQEHKPVKQEIPTERKTRKRNSLKDFIVDSSSTLSEEEDPSEFYPKINRIITKDPSWKEDNDNDYSSSESDETSSSPTSSSDDEIRIIEPKKLNKKVSVSFLESLSNYVPIEDKHCDAKQYFTQSGFKYKKKRQKLAEKLFFIFDKDVFSSQLSNKVTVVWSARLTTTAGHCTTRRSSQTGTITLSQKVCDSPERCRDTLLHEMCHAAVALIDSVSDGGHGPIWRKWTHKAGKCYPYLPAISVKHTYDIVYKFIYRCVQCQYEVHRHSKSINIDADRCGKCMGKFELLLNNNDNKPAENGTPKKTLTRYNLFVKENFQIMKQAQPHLSTPQLMKHLSQEYKERYQQQNNIDLPNLEQLHI